MVTIHLHNLEFFSYHGIHEEEKILGGWFQVDVDIKSDITKTVDRISDTIDYVSAFNIIQQKMNEPTPLLETLADTILNALHHFDSRITEIIFTVKKINPPIQGFIGNVGITMHKTF